jgi:hypothetical protein
MAMHFYFDFASTEGFLSAMQIEAFERSSS